MQTSESHKKDKTKSLFRANPLVDVEIIPKEKLDYQSKFDLFYNYFIVNLNNSYITIA